MAELSAGGTSTGETRSAASTRPTAALVARVSRSARGWICASSVASASSREVSGLRGASDMGVNVGLHGFHIRLHDLDALGQGLDAFQAGGPRRLLAQGFDD